jgi:thiamine biosynthesis lipoprotein
MQSPSSKLRRARPLLGTLVEVTACGHPSIVPAAVERAFAAIDRVHQLMSGHDPRSDVSRLNREGHLGPVEVDRHTWIVLAHAQRVSAASDGAFDLTVAPRLVRWGYLPGPGRPLPDPKPNGYQSIELLPRQRVRYHGPTVIDLGGIAKGYAVDLACDALEQCGVTDYVVNAGGDLRVGGTPTTVHVRHPSKPAATLELGTIRNSAIATSARYFAGKATRGGSVHPIVAPATGQPARYCGSISVRAMDCMTADALTKVVAVLGTEAVPVLGSFGAEAVLLLESGEWRRLPDRAAASAGAIGRSRAGNVAA